MINKTVEELRDKKFQKWWAHNPWRVVCVNNKKLLHMNMLLIFVGMLSAGLAVEATGIAEGIKYKQYKKAKSTLSEKELKEKYSKNQIVRFETYSTMYQKMKQK